LWLLLSLLEDVAAIVRLDIAVITIGVGTQAEGIVFLNGYAILAKVRPLGMLEIPVATVRALCLTVHGAPPVVIPASAQSTSTRLRTG